MSKTHEERTRWADSIQARVLRNAIDGPMDISALSTSDRAQLAAADEELRVAIDKAESLRDLFDSYIGCRPHSLDYAELEEAIEEKATETPA